MSTNSAFFVRSYLRSLLFHQTLIYSALLWIRKVICRLMIILRNWFDILSVNVKCVKLQTCSCANECGSTNRINIYFTILSYDLVRHQRHTIWSHSHTRQFNEKKMSSFHFSSSTTNDNKKKECENAYHHTSYNQKNCVHDILTMNFF